MRADTRKGGNHTTQALARPGLARRIRHQLQRLSGGLHGGAVLHIDGRGTQQKVSMHGGADQHALTHLGGRLEQGHREGKGLGMIQQVVFALARDDGKRLLGAELVMQPRRVHARAVNHDPGLHGATGRFQQVARPAGAHRLHKGIQQEVHPVDRCMVRQGAGQLIGAGDAAGGSQQGAYHARVDVGLQREDLLPLDHAQALHAVGHALLVQRLDVGALLLRKGQHHRAGLTIGRVHLGAQRRVHPRSLYIELCLERPWFGIEARVHDAAVGFAGALGHVAGALQQGDVRFIARQQSRHGTAHYASADDNDVPFQYEPSKRCGALCAICVLFYHGMRKNATPVPNFLTLLRQ